MDEQARWHPAITVVSRGEEYAIAPELMERIFAVASAGDGPSLAEVLLADARAVVAGPTVSQDWQSDKRDTARAVLFAAVACEVKIKATLLAKSPTQFADLLNVILENPREVSVAAGQLVDKPMKAAVGQSLREADKELFKAVSNDPVSTEEQGRPRRIPANDRRSAGIGHDGHEPLRLARRTAVQDGRLEV